LGAREDEGKKREVRASLSRREEEREGKGKMREKSWTPPIYRAP